MMIWYVAIIYTLTYKSTSQEFVLSIGDSVGTIISTTSGFKPIFGPNGTFLYTFIRAADTSDKRDP